MRGALQCGKGWSNRTYKGSCKGGRAHNPKVVGSNPAPATKQDGFSKPSFLFPIFSKMPENGLSMRFSNGNRNKLGKVESE